MFNLFLQREVGLVVLCLLSEVLPTLMDRQLEALPAGKAIADNVSHAAIAAASWMVILALSPPPFRSGCLLLADVRSPAHRCFSSFLSFLRRQRQSKVSRRAPSTPPTPPQLTTANLPVGGKEDAAVELVLVWRWATINVSGVKEAFLTACLGSALDVDHFLAAGSLQLSEAAGLARKPWGHSIAALVSAAAMVGIVTFSVRAGAAVFSAGASHQLRDSIRRGLWLYPPRGLETPPLTYPIYFVAQAALPLATTAFLRWNGVRFGVWRTLGNWRFQRNRVVAKEAFERHGDCDRDEDHELLSLIAV